MRPIFIRECIFFLFSFPGWAPAPPSRKIKEGEKKRKICGMRKERRK
jgi:hypothetical protein